MPLAGKPPDVSSRGLIAAIIVALFIITAAGTFIYQSQEEQIRKQVTGDLTAIGHLKSGQISTWREDRLNDARVISSSAFFIEGADHYLTYGDEESREKILIRFREMNESYHYDNVMLLNAQGDVRVSLDPAITSIQPAVLAKVNESLKNGTVAFIDFYRKPGSQGIRLGVIAPLVMKTDGHNKPVGAVLLSVNPDEFLYPLVQSWPVPSGSAETLLIEREGDHVLFLNDLRYQNNTALNLTIPLSRTDVPAVMGVLGSTGAFTGRDYRGVDVISVLEPVPGSPWFMVAKVDSAEAYSVWRSNAALIIVLTAASLAGAIIIIGLVWQRRQKYYFWSLYTAEAERGREEVQNRERMETLLHLAEMESAGEQELADFVLDAGCRLTESPLAFIGMMSPDESVFDITAWSKSAMKECSVAASPIHYPIDKAGVWADAVRQRKPIIMNDYPAPLPGKKGLPAGHVPITRFVSVPILEKQRIVMVCAVANKEADYSDTDVDNLTLLMQGAWNQFRKRKADEALRQKTADLEAAHEELTATDEELAANYEALARNQQALTESERRYRNLYQYAQVGLFETSFKDGTVVACNRQYAELAGFPSVEAAIGQDILHLYANPEDRTEVARILREQGYIENHTVKFRNQATGREFWGQFSARFNYEQEVAEGTIIDVTVQKEAEFKVLESEKRLLLALEVSQMGTWELDLVRHTATRSLRHDQIFGYENLLPEWTYEMFLEHVVPADRAYVDEKFQEAQEKKEDWNFTCHIRRTDSAVRWIMARGRGEYGNDGSPIRMTGIVQDITVAKEAEVEIRNAKNFLDNIIEQSPNPIWISDKNGTLLRLNKACCDVLRITPEEVVGKYNVFEDSIVEAQGKMPLVRSVFEEGKSVNFDLEYDSKLLASPALQRHGKVYLNVTIFPVRDSSGRITNAVIQHLDFTERRKVEAALKESEDAFRSLAENASDGFLVGAANGMHVFANKRAAEITGFSTEELVHTSIRQLVHPEEFERVVNERFRKHMAGEPAPNHYETIIVGKDGRQIPIELSSSQIAWYGQPADLIVFRDITERKTIVDRLRENEARLAMALDVGNAGVWQWNTETNEVFFDDRFHALLGYSPDELPHTLQEWLPYHNQEDVPVWMGKAEAYLRGESPAYESEHRIRAKDGSWAWVFTRGQFVTSPTLGPKKLFVGIAMNVTGRKWAEDAFHETTEYLQNLFNYGNVPIIVWNPLFRITRFNHAFENLTGRTEQDVVGQHLDILFPETSREVSLEHIRRTVGGERWETVEIPILHVSGRTSTVLWNSSNIVDSRGTLISTIAQGYDITDRKAVVDALRQSEEKYRVLFTRMTEGSALHEMVYDTSGNPVDYRILDVNPSFESVLGIRREDIVGKTSREAYNVDTPPYLDTYAQVAATGNPALFEEYFAPMKKYFSVSVFSPERGQFATIFEDITERKQAEEFRERLIKELEQKNAELERFTYTVSHDLKSPLITIKGFAGLLADDAGKRDPVQLKKDVQRIIAAADTMQELLADVLELSRIGRVVSPLKKTSFGTIAREAVDLLAGPLAERDVWMDIAADLPVVSVDHARIREVMVNLIENAVKFMGSQQNPVIRIGVETDGKTPVFFVQDNGIGIDPRYLERIFNLFERLDTSTHGTGIGLTIVRRIIEVHGGKIWAESEGVGKGTTFRFTLPGPASDGDRGDQDHAN
jgi:PAS domain S-box-containing protein